MWKHSFAICVCPMPLVGGLDLMWTAVTSLLCWQLWTWICVVLEIDDLELTWHFTGLPLVFGGSHCLIRFSVFSNCWRKIPEGQDKSGFLSNLFFFFLPSPGNLLQRGRVLKWDLWPYKVPMLCLYGLCRSTWMQPIVIIFFLVPTDLVLHIGV